MRKILNRSAAKYWLVSALMFGAGITACQARAATLTLTVTYSERKSESGEDRPKSCKVSLKPSSKAWTDAQQINMAEVSPGKAVTIDVPDSTLCDVVVVRSADGTFNDELNVVNNNQLELKKLLANGPPQQPFL